jgi:hypothetical protein
VPEDADDKDIKGAYREAALAYHPDCIPEGVSKSMGKMQLKRGWRFRKRLRSHADILNQRKAQSEQARLLK